MKSFMNDIKKLWHSILETLSLEPVPERTLKPKPEPEIKLEPEFTGHDKYIKNKRLFLNVRHEGGAEEFFTDYNHRRVLYKEFAIYNRMAKQIRKGEIVSEGAVWNLYYKDGVVSFKFNNIKHVTMRWKD